MPLLKHLGNCQPAAGAPPIHGHLQVSQINVHSYFLPPRSLEVDNNLKPKDCRVEHPSGADFWKFL